MFNAYVKVALNTLLIYGISNIYNMGRRDFPDILYAKSLRAYNYYIRQIMNPMLQVIIIISLLAL